MFSRLVTLHVAALRVASHYDATRHERQSERGATAVEYALMVMLIALVIIGGVTAIGTQLKSLFNGAATGI